MDTRTFSITNTDSRIEWVGKKVTGSHNGTIDISAGTLDITDCQLTGGSIVIDTTSIRILDVTDPNTNAQFAGHLASEDFFASAKYPTATLDITSVSKDRANQYHIAANLTIKAITHPVEFEAELAPIQDDTLHATGRLVIDRTKYDMKFRSGNFFKDLGDNLIYNNFTLDITITAKAA